MARYMVLSHDDEHAKVAERVDAFRAMPVRAPKGTPGGQGAYRLRRREAYKKAAWAVRWHLGKSHGFRRIVGPPLTLDDVEAVHAKYHEAGS